MKIAAARQVTISQEAREGFVPTPGANVTSEIESAAATIVERPQDSARNGRGETLVDRLRGAGDFKMTTDEVLALMRGPPPDEDSPSRK